MLFRVGFFIFISVFESLSRLPFWLLYRASDLFFVLLFHVFRYRRAIAETHLAMAFPEKAPEERHRILRASYQHLTDMVVETLKLLTISDENMRKRMELTTPELFDQLNRVGQEKGTGVIFISSHCGNFEWMSRGVVIHSKLAAYGVYSPMKNRFFDYLLVRARERTGGRLIPMRNAIQNAMELMRKPVLLGFLCDQSPARHHKYPLFFMPFFGIPTAVHERCAELALKTGVPVYFTEITKVRRGHYQFALHPLPVDKFQPYTPENARQFTVLHNQLLESIIRKQPECWFWTHRRWKHQPRDGDIIAAAAPAATAARTSQ